MIKALIKKQISELFSVYFISRKTGKARSKKGTVGFIILAICLITVIAGSLFALGMGLGVQLFNKGYAWIFFSITSLMSITLGVIGSVFTTFSSLYLPKDNEMLASLPIPPGKLLFSRIIGVYTTSLLYTSLVWIPTSVAYWVMVPVKISSVIIPLLLCFFITLFVSVVSCLLGWIVALIASKTKGKSYITVIITVLFLAGYYILYFKLNVYLRNLTAHINSLSEKLHSYFFYVYLLGKGAAGDMKSLLLFLAITLALALILFFIMSKTFFKTVLLQNNVKKKAKNDEKYTANSVPTALLKREYRHFSSVSSWMLNGGLGLLFLTAAAVAAIIKCAAVREFIALASGKFPVLINALPVLVFMVSAVIVSMDVVTSASISIEGKGLYLLRTLPVKSWEILRAKERMDLHLHTIPVLFFVISVCVVIQISAINTVLTCIMALTYVLFKSDFGIMSDLKHANLTWTNVVVPTKQNISVVIQLFGGWLISFVFAAIMFLLSFAVNITLVLGVCTVLLVIFTALNRRRLKTKGVKLFEAL